MGVDLAVLLAVSDRVEDNGVFVENMGVGVTASSKAGYIRRGLEMDGCLGSGEPSLERFLDEKMKFLMPFLEVVPLSSSGV